MSEIFVCVPCRITREATIGPMEKTRNCRDKGTCAICKRRRFGDYYKPIRRRRKKKETDG